MANTSLARNPSKGLVSSSMNKFYITKLLEVIGHPQKATTIVPVIWNPPACGWTKCNTDGWVNRWGGVFRDRNSVVIGCFASFNGSNCSFQAKILASMKAIEIAHDNGWNKLWLECGLILVVQVLSYFGSFAP